MAELNPGGRIPPELETRSLQILTHEVLPALRCRKDTSMVRCLRPTRTSSSRPICGRRASTRPSAIARPGCSGSTAPTRSWSRPTRSSPGIGLISNAGARFDAPETISAQGRFEDVHRGGYDPEQHLRDMRLDGVAGEVLYPSQGLFYFRVADSALMSAIFRAYNDWLAEFCRTDPARLKGIAMINLDDVQDGIKELERAARLGLAGAMITEYPLEHRRYDQPEYEPFWAAAEALDMPLSLHTATRRQGKIRGAGDKTLRDAEQPGDEGVLSGALDVRHDLLRRLRAPSRA